MDFNEVQKAEDMQKIGDVLISRGSAGYRRKSDDNVHSATVLIGWAANDYGRVDAIALNARQRSDDKYAVRFDWSGRRLFTDKNVGLGETWQASLNKSALKVWSEYSSRIFTDKSAAEAQALKQNDAKRAALRKQAEKELRKEQAGLRIEVKGEHDSDKHVVEVVMNDDKIELWVSKSWGQPDIFKGDVAEAIFQVLQNARKGGKA